MRTAAPLAFTDRSLVWADRGMLESTAEHRRTELDLVRREQHLRANLVRELLLGAVAPSELRLQALAYGLDLGAIYVPFRVSIAGASFTGPDVAVALNENAQVAHWPATGLPIVGATAAQ